MTRGDKPYYDDKSRHTLFALLGIGMVYDEVNSEFLEMLDQSQRTLFQVCLHFTDRQPDNIRDLYQEIVCALWESWPDFRHDCSTDTWVHRIALNVAITQVRRHARQPRFVPLDDWMYDTIAEEIDKAPPDYFSLVSELEPDDRALLYLRLDHHSLQDIADTLSITESAVKQRLYRLRQRINTLKQQDYE